MTQRGDEDGILTGLIELMALSPWVGGGGGASLSGCTGADCFLLAGAPHQLWFDFHLSESYSYLPSPRAAARPCFSSSTSLCGIFLFWLEAAFSSS